MPEAVIVKRPKVLAKPNEEEVYISPKGLLYDKEIPVQQDVTFSWQEPEPVADTESEIQHQESVVIPDKPKPKKDRFLVNTFLSILALIGVGVAGKEGFDYVQKFESLKLISTQITKQDEFDPQLRDQLSSLKFSAPVVETPVVEEPKVEEEPPVTLPSIAVNDPDALIKILEAKNLYLRALRNDGKVELRTGGSVSWRLHNIGRLLEGDYSKATGSIGAYAKYAVYPSQEVGRKSLKDMLFKTDVYGEKTILEAMKLYAPVKDKFDPTKYAKAAAKAAGVSTSTIMNQLSDNKQEMFLDEIKKLEGYISGKVTVFKDIEDWEKRGY